MRDKPPEKDRSERYLLTYADLMNLLLILFIVLFCTSTQNVVKASAVMQAIQKSFTNKTTVVATSSTSSKTTGSKTQPTTDYSDFYKQLIALLKQRGLLSKVDITQSNNEVIISLKDNVLFDSSKADLSASAKSLLTNIGQLMTKISYGQLIIEGHTDSDPIHTPQFQDNRELSLMRAYNVSEVFEASGLDPAKILPVGYGQYYPVAKNDTPADKAKNRRVVLTILRNGVTPADESVTSAELVQTMQDAAVGKLEPSSSSGTSSVSKAAAKK